jgi:lipoprotein-releasing system ATP-binding protein
MSIQYQKKALLEAKNLHHSFVEGETITKVLKGVSLEIRAGETTAISGPSGCGKSTLLYLLGLLDRPDTGEIFLHGKDVSQTDDSTRTNLRNHSIGFVFQFHFLIKELSVIENVALPIRKAGVSKEIAKSRALSALTRLGMESKANRFANKLSGGEQQRVAIARAIANSPSLILADEPTGNLDSANSENVFSLLDNLALQENLGVLLVTHNPELAQRCSKKINIRDGLII